MGIIETVIILSLYVYDGGNKNIEGWYHQDNLSTCLAAKSIIIIHYHFFIKMFYKNLIKGKGGGASLGFFLNSLAD